MNTSFIIRPMSRNDFSGLTEVIDTSFLWLVRSLALHSVREGQQVLISEAQGTAVGFVKLTNFQVGSDKFGAYNGSRFTRNFAEKELRLHS